LAALDGKLHIVWQDFGDGDWDIYYRLFDGIAWQPEEKISIDEANEHQQVARIAVEGNEVHVVWADGNDPDYDIFYRHYDGTSWQPEFEVSNDSGSERQWIPAIAVDDGNVHIVWRDTGGGDDDIFYRCFNGTEWLPEQEISSDQSDERQSSPAIAAEGGNVHVVWLDWEDGGVDTDIHYRQFNGTAWMPEEEISEDAMGEGQDSPQIVAEDGNLHVVYLDNGDGDSDVVYRRFNGTDWESEIEVSVDAGTEHQQWPGLAVEGDHVHVVWYDKKFIMDDEEVYYRHFDGTMWQPVMELSNDTASEQQLYPAVAADQDGVHVAWMDEEDGDWDIYYRKGSADFGRPVSVAAPIPNYWQPSATFDIEWTATDNAELANVSLYYRFSPDNVSWSSWVLWAYDDAVSGPFASGTFPFTCPSGEGIYEFYSIAEDTSNNTELPPIAPDTAAGLDLTEPSGSISINSDDEWATSDSVNLSLTYSDGLSGVARARYSNDGIWDTEPWELPTPTKSWTLTPGDGTKTVYYQVTDNAGLESMTYSDDIELDTTAPSIVSIDPSDGETGVELTSGIVVTFSEEMNISATIDSFSLMMDATQVSGTINWSMDGRVLTFNSTDSLQPWTEYHVVIATDAKDLVGNALEIQVETTFRTLNTIPTCGILSPTTGEILSHNYTILGTAYDDEGMLEKVEIRIDDGPWIEVFGTASWSYDWNTTTFSDGNHTIYARSYDGINYSDEASVIVTVDNYVPPPPGEESLFEQVWFWVAVVVALVILLIVLMLIGKRRKREETEPPA
jgi:hypothetical protein